MKRIALPDGRSVLISDQSRIPLNWAGPLPLPPLLTLQEMVRKTMRWRLCVLAALLRGAK